MRTGLLCVAVSGILLGACSKRTTTVVVAPEPRRLPTPPPPPPSQPPAPRPSTAATLGIPPGHLPEAGECRIWIPGTPPGRQPGSKSRPCAGIGGDAPAGSWIVYRPTRDRKLVHVRVVDARRPGFVTLVRLFEIDSGRLLRDMRPEDEPQDEPAPDDRRGNDRPDNQRPNNERPGNERPGYQRPPEPPAPPRSIERLDIPNGQLPDEGQCRVWIPGTAPGQQPKPKSRTCDGIAAAAPTGSWILYRPAGQRVVHVRTGSATKVFDIQTNQLLEEKP